MSTRKTVSLFLLFFVLLTILLSACRDGTTGRPASLQVTSIPKRSQLVPTAAQTTPTSLYKVHKVYVTLWEFKIISSVTIFKPNIPYRFIITNRGGIDHLFMIVSTKLNPEKIVTADLHKMALIIVDDIAPEVTKTVDYIFPLYTLAGGYEMACHLRGQYQAGMKLSITVKDEE
jgi:uncharacterized cupredoxin-like copper-binding protein